MISGQQETALREIVGKRENWVDHIQTQSAVPTDTYFRSDLFTIRYY